MWTAWIWASCPGGGSAKKRRRTSSMVPPSRGTARSCVGGFPDGSRARARPSTSAPSQPTTARRMVTFCSSEPHQTRLNIFVGSMRWRKSSARRHAIRYPSQTSRGCRFRRASGRERSLMPKKLVVRTDKAPAPLQGAPYSQAIKVDNLVFVSGQIALKPGETALTGVTAGEQTEQVFANLKAILEAAGSRLDRLVKHTPLLARLEDLA